MHVRLFKNFQPTDVFELDVEEAFYSGVSLVEWPEKMGGFLPRDSWLVVFSAEGNNRKITVTTFDEEKLGRLQNV